MFACTYLIYSQAKSDANGKLNCDILKKKKFFDVLTHLNLLYNIDKFQLLTKSRSGYTTYIPCSLVQHNKNISIRSEKYCSLLF